MENEKEIGKRSSDLFASIKFLCDGESVVEILAALFSMISTVLYQVPVDKREKVLVGLDKKIREGIKLVSVLEEEKDGKQSDF